MLAAIVITAAIGLIDVAAARRLYRIRRSEFILWLAAFLGVALFGVLLGIFLAILLSLGDVVRRAWRPHDAASAARTSSRARSRTAASAAACSRPTAPTGSSHPGHAVNGYVDATGTSWVDWEERPTLDEPVPGRPRRGAGPGDLPS